MLPKYLVEYYQVMCYEKNGEQLHFYFEEINAIPEEDLKHRLNLKSFFYVAVIIQNFTIRGQYYRFPIVFMFENSP